VSTEQGNQTFGTAGGVFPGVDALGVYHLLRPIATGGMARVWLAVDARDGREVAIKRMLPALASDAELRNAFSDEAELGLRLRHPNIVDTIELGDGASASGAEPYLVLELLHGRPLIDVLRAAARQKVRIPLGFVMRAVADAARGLDHAHKLTGADGRTLGIVHRDVSPHNLFVCASGTIKVLDFGIAKAREQSHKTRTGVIKGKFAYLSPEQIRGQIPDARLDVFSLGIILYELLAGRPLFRGANDAETLHRVLSYEIPAPEIARTDVPSALGAVALRALQRDRDRRLPSAAALVDALDAVAEAEQIQASPAVVRDFVASLFPNDAQDHAEDKALARRTYEHLSSSSLRALGSNPWMTPADGIVAHERAPRSLRTRIALGIGAVLLTAAAAITTATLLARTHRQASLPVAAVASVVDPPVTIPAPFIPLPAPGTGLSTNDLVARIPVTPSTSVARPIARVSATPHRAPVGTGQLRLGAHPWAEVLVDGKLLGTTPLRPTTLSAGAHTVVLRNQELGVNVKRRVTVQAGKEIALVVDLFAERKSR